MQDNPKARLLRQKQTEVEKVLSSYGYGSGA